jgi:hypothetical protein
MDRVAKYFKKQLKLFLVIASFGVVMLLGGLDYLTGSEIFVPIFYLIPVSLAAWFGGGWAGIGVSIVSALIGLSIDLILRSPYSHPANMLAGAPPWNRFLFIPVTALRQVFSWPCSSATGSAGLPRWTCGGGSITISPWRL